MVDVVYGREMRFNRADIDLLSVDLMNKYGFKKVKIKDVSATLFKRPTMFHSLIFSDSDETHNMEIEFELCKVDNCDYQVIQDITIFNRSNKTIQMVKEDILKFINVEEEINNMVKTESVVKVDDEKVLVSNEVSKMYVNAEGDITAKGTKICMNPNEINVEIFGEWCTNTIKVPIKYFEGATELEKISKGDWIDVYARKDVFVPFLGQAMIPLGFAMELPKGMEGHLAPRGSTMKSWGMIQTNSVGIVDNSFAGDNDEWQFPAQCTMPHECIATQIEGHKVRLSGTWIRKGDKVAQFRIVDNMKDVEFVVKESLGNADRGMEGSTGSTKLNK